MARPSNHKAVVDTLVDEELDLRNLVEKVNGKSQAVADHIMAMVARLFGPQSHRHVSKQLLRQAWDTVFLEAFVQFVHEGQRHVDQNLRQQIAAIRKLGGPVTEIAAVTNEDVKARETEKAIG